MMDVAFIKSTLRLHCALFVTLFIIGSFSTLLAATETSGKFDIGPTYVHLDVLESGRTVNRMNLYGIKADLTYNIYRGFCVKPSLLVTGCHDGSLTMAAIGFGYYIPVLEHFAVLPSVGLGWSYVSTYISIKDLGLKDLKETFRSRSPYAALEVSYTLNKCWRLSGLFQYSWSRTHTKIDHFVNSRESCSGPSYAVMFESDLSKRASINFGAGYNLSLNKERHGIRGYGIKMGFAYWF